MLTAKQRQFLEAARVARFATADANGQPHVLPICFTLIDASAYFSIDGKPKKKGGPLKRLKNLIENPRAALVIDHYEEDWQRLGWVMLQGAAEILERGDEHDLAQAKLRERYPQLSSMEIASLPVVAIRIAHVSSWGCLDLP